MSDIDRSNADDPEGVTEPEPGDAQGVPVPHEQAAEGSSETFEAVEGVRVIHPPAGQEGSNEADDVDG